MSDYYTAGKLSQMMLEQYHKEATKAQLVEEAQETRETKTLKEKKEKPAKVRFLAFLGQH